MTKLINALISLSLMGAALLPAQALAQDKPALAPAASAAKATLSSQSLVGDLMADPDAKAVLTADIPEVVANPQLTMGYSMKLADIAQFEPSLTPATLAKIDKDLAAMQAKRGH
jgi:hypothetical protein